MINDGLCTKYVDEIKLEVLNIIDMLYYANSPSKKLLYDMGFYEKDIDSIIKIIGEDFDDINDLKNRIQNNKIKIFNNKTIGYISKYVIDNLL
jgi:chlorite dismutase